MSLSECFERFDRETWRDNLGLSKLLFMPRETIDDPKSVAYAWLKTILGVNAGRIGFKSIFEERLSENRFREAFDILEYFLEEEQSDLKRKLFEEVTRHYSGILQKLETLDRRVLEIQRRIISKFGKPLLDDVKINLERVKAWMFPGNLSDETLQSYESYIKELTALEDTVVLLEMEDQSFLRELFEVYYRVVDKVKDKLLNDREFSQELMSKCFLSLPSLVLNGDRDTLQGILNALDTHNIEYLQEMQFPKTYMFGRQVEYKTDRVPKVMKERDILSGPLRSITKRFWDDIPKLDGKFESIGAARAFIDKQTRNSRTFQDAANILIGGAKAVSFMGDNNVIDLQAKGLMELAQHHLISKNYTYALELFIDSFCTWVIITGETGDLSDDERKTVTGILLADWAPKIIALQQNQDIVEMANYFFENPTIMLDKIAAGNDFEVIFHSFDQLNDYAALKRFLNYLEETSPKFDWTSILAERILQPRLFLQKPEKNIFQLRALIEGRYSQIGLVKVVQNLGSVIDAGALKENTFGVELFELEREIEGLRNKIQENMNGDLPAIATLLEGMEGVVKSIKGRIQPANEIQFSVRPINTAFYLDEKTSGLELVFIISLQDSSLPTNSFIVEARIERRQKERMAPFITFQNTKVELGPLEPGSVEEICFVLNINDTILQEFSEVSIELNFLEGVKVIEPLDRKKVFQVSLRNNRKGTRANPYVAGPALEKGSLYVGREQELKRIKSTLIGQSQDNIPLILGIRKVGKTSLLKRLVADDEIKRKYVSVFVDLEDMPESETTSIFLKKLCERIHERCGDKWGIAFSRSSFDEDPFEAFEKYVLRFSTAPGSLRVLIVMDEFEKLIANLEKWQTRIDNSNLLPNACDALVPEVLGALRKAMLHATRISFVVAGLPHIKSRFEDYEARWFALMTPMVLKPFDREDAKKLIQPTSMPYKVSSEAVDEILYMTGGQPYLIQLLCWQLFFEITESGKETAARRDVAKIIDQYILANEGYLKEYRALIGEDSDLLKAIAIIHRRYTRRRRFVSVEEILDVRRKSGDQMSRNEILDRLKEMEKVERPLVERSPNRLDAYRIAIGTLSRVLEEES